MISEIVCTLQEIPENGSIRRTVGGRDLAIFRKGGQVYAIDAICPHRRGPLDGTELEDDFIVVCPWHGWRFDVRTGKSPSHPGQVLCYQAEVVDGQVRVTVTP